MRWWTFMRTRRQREDDLDRELQAHIQLETEEQQESGIGAAEAHYAARRILGNTISIKERVREMWGWMTLEQLAQDMRYAIRTMRKSPGFTLTAVLSLALGIGANTAIFTVVNAVLLRPLPFPESDRLVQIWETQPNQGFSRNVVNGLNFLDWRERTRSFEDMAAVESGVITNLTGLGEPLALQGREVSPGFFSILGVSPALGRSFVPEEGLPVTNAFRS